MPHDQPPEPWHSFFREIDDSLKDSIVLHCIGGFAISMLFDLPRPTVDVDVGDILPVDEVANLQILAAMDQRCTASTGSICSTWA